MLSIDRLIIEFDKGLRTLAGGTGRSAESSLLTSRRRALLVMSSIERGTRWAVFDAGDRGAA